MLKAMKAGYTRVKETMGKVGTVVKGAVIGGLAYLGIQTNEVYAQATGVDFTSVTISTADIFTFAGIILAAIGSIWGIRKLVKLGNKS